MLLRGCSRNVNFLTNLIRPEVYLRLFIEYHGKNITPKPKNASLAVLSTVSVATENIFTGTLTQDRFVVVVAFASVLSSSKQTALV